MNLRILLIMLVLTVSFGAAERPSEIPLWPQGAPGSEGKPMKELVTTSASGELSVSGIHNPSITPYLPAEGQGHRPGDPRHPRRRPSRAGDHARGIQRRGVAAGSRHRGVRPQAPARARGRFDLQDRCRVVRRHQARASADPQPGGGMGHRSAPRRRDRVFRRWRARLDGEHARSTPAMRRRPIRSIGKTPNRIFRR